MPRAGDIDAEWTDDECLQKIRFCDAIFNVYELQRVSADADDVDPNSTPAVVGPGRDRQQRWEREFRLAFGEIASGRSIDVEWFSENQGRVEIYAAGVDEPLHSTGSISTTSKRERLMRDNRWFTATVSSRTRTMKLESLMTDRVGRWKIRGVFSAPRQNGCDFFLRVAPGGRPAAVLIEPRENLDLAILGFTIERSP